MKLKFVAPILACAVLTVSLPVAASAADDGYTFVIRGGAKRATPEQIAASNAELERAGVWDIVDQRVEEIVSAQVTENGSFRGGAKRATPEQIAASNAELERAGVWDIVDQRVEEIVSAQVTENGSFRGGAKRAMPEQIAAANAELEEAGIAEIVEETAAAPGVSGEAGTETGSNVTANMPSFGWYYSNVDYYFAQEKAMSCGPASVRMVLFPLNYNLSYTEAEIREATGWSQTDGSYLCDLVDFLNEVQHNHFWTVYGASKGTVQNSLLTGIANGNGCIVGLTESTDFGFPYDIDGHFVVISCINTSATEVEVLDPWTGYVSPGTTGSYFMSMDDLYEGYDYYDGSIGLAFSS
ncbi:MAG: hypothetical protein LUF91_06125 [Oscillospiraceae bacterium]|nr:hypothetical protein [Oscillospiraceae bacterium]